jgi:hypothetical protein
MEGPIGPSSSYSPTGPAGDTGPQGSSGAPGDQGPAGEPGITGNIGPVGPTAAITSVFFISGPTAAYSNTGYTGISTFIIEPGNGVTGALYAISWTLNETLETVVRGNSSVYIDFNDGVTGYVPFNVNTGATGNGSVMYSIQYTSSINQTTSVNDFVDLSNYAGATGLKCNIYQKNNTVDTNPVTINSYKMALRMTQR